MTLDQGQFVARFIDEHLPKLEATNARDQKSMLEKLVLPDWKNRLVAEITPTDVDRLLTRIAEGRARPAQPRPKTRRRTPPAPPKPTPVRANRVGEVLRKAGELTGTRITRHPVNSDRYFAHSDNQALADLGVPAHTVSVAYAFPDYHGPADTWDKIDYDNMAAINRTVALALQTIANDPQAPRWNTANPKTAKYVEAARKLKP